MLFKWTLSSPRKQGGFLENSCNAHCLLVLHAIKDIFIKDKKIYSSHLSSLITFFFTAHLVMIAPMGSNDELKIILKGEDIGKSV